ncbi:DNA polymerase [uncultured Gemmiger sp.]|uniref:DNA polymerase n=1 Tax=uncultured Gemmiger sp. TaxID=1623490 RepID=UPI0025E410FD|nr:DNA polymerase [uncultured Gemmiger sp.]
MILTIDLETYSPQDIGKVGAYRYAQDPDFEILLASMAVDDGRVQLYDLAYGESWFELKNLQNELFDPKYTKRAWNAAFEWWCLSEYFHLTQQEREDWLDQWQDSMVHAMYCGLPASLKMAGQALQLPEDKAKMREGAALIRYFCCPCKPTKVNGGRTRNLPEHDTAKWEIFRQYNIRDVETERHIDHLLEPFTVPDFIWQQWRDDVRMNSRGIATDAELTSGALWCGRQYSAELFTEAQQITGLANPNAPGQLRAWLAANGADLPDLRKETVAEALKQPQTAKARQVLELRQELGKSSLKKYDAIQAATGPDGRIRGTLQFYGATRTGRWAGRLLQVQNLPRTYVKHQDEIRELIKARQLSALEMIYGNVNDLLSQMIRTALIPAPGSVFIDADFSAIEARLIAWEAGEEWVLDVFRTTGKIYETTASKMFGIPVETIVKGNPNYSYRQRGKVATLALGYQGGVGAMRRMDTSGALKDLPDEEIQDMVNRWRQQNPNIVTLWRTMEAAAKLAIKQKRGFAAIKGVTFRMEASTTCPFPFLTMSLPSGRKLYYADPRVSDDGHIHYREQTNAGWQDSETYGGKLTENLTQAIGRDCLEYALDNLKQAGYRVVFHIHDEVVIERKSADPEADLQEVRRIMSKPAPWAKGLPLNAEGWVGQFFTKD